MQLFKKTYILILLCLLVCSLVVAGCGSKGASITGGDDNNTPITLKVAGLDKPDIFDQRIGDLIKKKFPNITIVYTQYGNGNDLLKLQDLVSKGETPDLIEGFEGADVHIWEDLGLTYDLRPLVAKYKLDLSRYIPEFLQSITNNAPNNELFALPYYPYLNALFYNKDIFDKFAVPYPKDGMTWPQIVDLGKQLTRIESNTQYIGFVPDDFFRLSREYPLLFLDPKTDKAAVTDEKWVKFMEFFKNIYSEPGSSTNFYWGSDPFFKDRTLAMYPGPTDRLFDVDASVKNGLNFDIVSFPTFPDAPGLGPALRGRMWGISSTSTYKDQAFKVITYIGSDEVQAHLAKIGVAPALANHDIQKLFGSETPVLNGKNLTAPYYIKSNVFPKERSRYETIAQNLMYNTVTDIITGKKDINTALLEASDKINQAVTSAKQASK